MALDPSTVNKLKSAVQDYDDTIDELNGEISRLRATGQDVSAIQSRVDNLAKTVTSLKAQYQTEINS